MEKSKAMKSKRIIRYCTLLILALLVSAGITPQGVRAASLPAYDVSTNITFPLPLKHAWFVTTYKGHGKISKASYSCVDIKWKKGNSRGTPVYAVAEGKVTSSYPSNGQITIRHTKRLTTMNDVSYDTWFTTYAHMRNITVKVGSKVKAGQKIGEVSDVGKATGPHLHFSIAGADAVTGKKKYAVSPYYVKGFRAAIGQDRKYVNCDVKGPQVTKALLNYKPVNSRYHVDLNSWFNNAYTNNIAAFATADVYINGKLTANDVTDYFKMWPEGTKWEIRDIRPKTGYQFDGGVLSGSVGAHNARITLRFSRRQGNYQVNFRDESGNLLSSQTLKKGSVFTTDSRSLTKPGYVLYGWHAHRQSDDTYYVTGKGWMKDAAIDSAGLRRKVYGKGESLTFNDSWTKGGGSSDDYDFTPVWTDCRHTWDTGKVTKQPTTTEYGVCLYTCTICKDTYKQSIAMLKEENTEKVSTLKLGNAFSPSGTLWKGGCFTIAGKVTSNYNITNVTAKVIGSDGKVRFSGSAAPNAKSYSLYLLDGKMAFSGLAAGSYTYQVTATDEVKSVTLVSSTFKVAAATITGSSMTYPTSITKGNTFSIKGTVKASNTIKTVALSVCSTDGVRQFSASASPNAASYNVHNLDSKMTFKKLGTGKYIYRCAVTDQKGITRYVISKSFTVK